MALHQISQRTTSYSTATSRIYWADKIPARLLEFEVILAIKYLNVMFEDRRTLQSYMGYLYRKALKFLINVSCKHYTYYCPPTVYSLITTG